MKRTKTSKQWMMEHVNDVYVQRAKAAGYRSRAAYKLIESAARDKLLKPGMVVVDLGADEDCMASRTAQLIDFVELELMARKMLLGMANNQCTPKAVPRRSSNAAGWSC